MSAHSPFLEVFPGCADLRSCAGGLEKAYITDVQIKLSDKTMAVSAWFPTDPAPAELSMLCERLKADYGLEGVGISPDYPRARASVPAMAVKKAGGVPSGDVIFGRAIRQKPVPMETVDLESGKVTVEGDVIAVNHRTGLKKGGAVMSFDITDRTNSLTVQRYF